MSKFSNITKENLFNNFYNKTDIDEQMKDVAHIVDDPNIPDDSIDDIVKDNLKLEFDEHYIYLKYAGTTLSKIPRVGVSVVPCIGISFDIEKDEIRSATMGETHLPQKYTVEPSDCTEIIQFSSSNINVATVNPNTGSITIVNDGITTIKVVCGEFSASYELTVVNLSVCKIIVITDSGKQIIKQLNSGETTYQASIESIDPVDCVALKTYSVESLVYTNTAGTQQTLIPSINSETGLVTFNVDNGGIGRITVKCGDATDTTDVYCVRYPGCICSITVLNSYAQNGIHIASNGDRFAVQTENGIFNEMFDGDVITFKHVKITESTNWIKFGMTPIFTNYTNKMFGISGGCVFYEGARYQDPGWQTTGAMTVTRTGNVLTFDKNNVETNINLNDSYRNGCTFVIGVNNAIASNPIIWNGIQYRNMNDFSDKLLNEIVSIKKNGVLLFGCELIEFKIDNTPYLCKSGITWNDFCNHIGYNKLGLIISGEEIHTSDNLKKLTGVSLTDVITDGTEYVTETISVV